jgi:hypothetical protein
MSSSAMDPGQEHYIRDTMKIGIMVAGKSELKHILKHDIVSRAKYVHPVTITVWKNLIDSHCLRWCRIQEYCKLMGVMVYF